jgi:peptide/nickel transport system permease protein
MRLGTWRLLLRNPNAVMGAILLLLVAAMALMAPLVYPDDPSDMVALPYVWPGQQLGYPLGTDNLGRDVTAGIMHGARVSLWVGFISTALCLVLGTAVGALGGYFGGTIDDALSRLTELFQTIPPFLFLIVLVAIAEPTVASITFCIGVVSWPTIARLVRAEFRALRGREFVQAAETLGYSHARIIVQEILPNALPPVIVTTSVMVATAILNESALSFLGLGDPNVVSWGSMVGNGREVLRTAWYLTAIPGAAIVVTVLALNLVGEALNDALNPRITES